MKGIIEASIYLILFALISLYSIDFIRINKEVSDAGEVSQYVENYIEAFCGDSKDAVLSETERNRRLEGLKSAVSKGGMTLELLDRDRAGDYEYISYTLKYSLRAAMFGYSSEHSFSGFARYCVN